MAIYTEPPAVVTGQTMTATNWNLWVRTNFQAVWPFTTAGDLAYASAANQLSRLGIGTGNKLLKSTGTAPDWATLAALLQAVDMVSGQTAGDLFYASGIASIARLGIGTVGKWLKSTGSAPLYEGLRGANVTRTSLQTIANAAYTAVAWNSELLDTAAFYAAGSPTRFTIPRTSNFLIGAKIEFSVFAYTGYGELKIYKNGSSTFLEDAKYSVATGGVAVRLNAIGLLAANAGDYFESFVWQNTGDSVNLTASRSFFYIIDVGP